MKKFGAMLGDEVEVGCGSVLNPGTVVGNHSNIYPLSSVRGFVPANSIYKKQGEVVTKEERLLKIENDENCSCVITWELS